MVCTRALTSIALLIALTACSQSNSGAPQPSPSPPDTTPPSLSLIGESTIAIRQGSAFIDPGVNAWDAHDGDLAASVTVHGQVNEHRSGQYLRTYRVEDAAGNSATLSRVIEVHAYHDETAPLTLPAYLQDVPELFDLKLWHGPSALTGSPVRAINSTGHWLSEGFHAAGDAYLLADNLELGSTSGFIYLSIERDTLSIPENANTRVFFDSHGKATADDALAPQAHTAFYLDQGAPGGPFQLLYKGRNHRLSFISEQWRLVDEYLAFNSHVSPPQNARFADLLFTWQAGQSAVYVDGLLVFMNSDADAGRDWQRLLVGRRPFGDALNGIIRRVTVGNSYVSALQRTPERTIAVLGDSFAVAGSSRATIIREDDADVAAIDALQTSFVETDTSRQIVKTSSRGTSGWIHQLQAAIALRHGFRAPIYNAACSGHGWINAPDRDRAGEIPEAYVRAAVAAQPDVLIVLASVNDLLAGIRVDHAMAHLREDLDFVIDNSPSLARILLIQTFGWYTPDHLSLHESEDFGEAWLARYKQYNASLQQLDGYRGVVEWVSHDWGSTPPREYLIGSAPGNSTISRQQDYHPSASGHIAIADILYQALAPHL